MNSFYDWVIQPNSQHINLNDSIKLILEFNETIQIDLVWKYNNKKWASNFKWGKQSKLLSLYVIKKFIFFSCLYKMINNTKKTLENNDIEVIVDSVNALWLNEKNIEEKLGHKNLPVITNKYDKI